MVDTTDEWILQRTGIRERHIVEPGVATSDLGTEAALKAIAKAGLTLNEIDHLAVPRNPYARLATKLFYSLRMPSFARERAKVMVK